MQIDNLLTVSEDWRARYPGAVVGILALGNVRNPSHHYGLEPLKSELLERLRVEYAGEDRQSLRSTPILMAYRAYYKGFRKTYHVLLQLESIVHKGKAIPGGPALVEAMFMAELSNLLLTAGHDLDSLSPPVRIEVAHGWERYIRINGQDQELKEGDMYITDQEGVMSSVIYGPDLRTQIKPDTRRVLYTTYAAPGIEPQLVNEHLADIEDLVRVFSPSAEREAMEVAQA